MVAAESACGACAVVASCHQVPFGLVTAKRSEDFGINYAGLMTYGHL
jgi:hypothetical protein